MPKTYNQRQMRDMLAEQAHAPSPPHEPDVTPYIRFFPRKEIAAIIERIERQVGAGKVTHLKPDTAYVAARALRAYNAKPSRDRIVREICVVRGGCDPWCVACIGKANAIMKLYDGIDHRKD
jgi:hypothetical protein